jgi:small subunit ribosomal protein S13
MKNSIQLFNVHLDLNKNLVVAFTKIFGINLAVSNIICKKFGFNRNSLLKDVHLSTINEIRKFILVEYSIQSGLRKSVRSSIAELISIKSFRGLRHKLKLPVRGQRTRSNHKTQKKVM